MELYGNILLTEGEIGGNIKYELGQPIMDNGFQSVVYISLFSNDWWGNQITEDFEKLDNGLDQFLDLKVTNQTRLTIISRAKVLLNWMILDGIADSIDIDAELGLNKIKLNIYLIKNKEKINLKYNINWTSELTNPAINLV